MWYVYVKIDKNYILKKIVYLRNIINFQYFKVYAKSVWKTSIGSLKNLSPLAKLHIFLLLKLYFLIYF